MSVVYNFNSSQRAALQALVDAGQWFNAYSFVLQMISGNGSSSCGSSFAEGMRFPGELPGEAAWGFSAQC